MLVWWRIREAYTAAISAVTEGKKRKPALAALVEREGSVLDSPRESHAS